MWTHMIFTDALKEKVIHIGWRSILDEFGNWYWQKNDMNSVHKVSASYWIWHKK